MELQTFTFYLLAFVALTDGAPRDMDNSIDMTKPDKAKAADLARGRRQEPGGFEPIDIDSEEAQIAKQEAMDWFHDKFPNLVFHFKSAEKQLVEDEWVAMYLINGEMERGREGESWKAQFKVYVSAEGDSEVSLAFPVGQLVTFPANQLTN